MYTYIYIHVHVYLHEFIHVHHVVGFRWHESRRSVRIELSTDKMEASLPRSSGNSWATVAGTLYMYMLIIRTLYMYMYITT